MDSSSNPYGRFEPDETPFGEGRTPIFIMACGHAIQNARVDCLLNGSNGISGSAPDCLVFRSCFYQALPMRRGSGPRPSALFGIHNPAPTAIQVRLTTTWPASRSRNSAILGIRAYTFRPTACSSDLKSVIRVLINGGSDLGIESHTDSLR